MIRYLKAGEPVPSSTPLRYKTTSGYIGLRWTISPGRYVECYEHRLVDGYVTDAEHVHHLNHDRTDNRPENLLHISAVEHHLQHGSVFADEAVALYAAGDNTSKIAEQLGLNPSHVYRLLRHRGVKFRDRNTDRRVAVDESKLRALHRQGLSTLQIAKAMGLERTVVRRQMKNLGLPANGRTYA